LRRSSLKHQAGFTLVELLLYISISASVLVAGSLFMATLFSGRIKHQAINEVEQQGLMLMHALTESVRSAQAINAPAIGTSSNSLSLDATVAANDPTIFNLNGSVMQLSEGAASPIALTNSRVSISDLQIQNLSRSGTPGTIRLSFTLTHNNPSNRQEYTYAKTFYGSATLRHP
jgi:type II secretory pathway pseudopilin PulG